MFDFDKLTSKINDMCDHSDELRRAAMVLELAGNSFNSNDNFLVTDEYQDQRDTLETMMKESMKSILSEIYTITGLMGDIRSESSGVLEEIKREVVAR